MNNTSQATSFLARPHGDGPVSDRALGYVCEMAREEVFDMVATACVEAGVPRGAIAKRLGKDAGQVSRLLSGPGNWTIDTIAELLFAIDGSMLRAARYHPEEEAIANNRHPGCVVSGVNGSTNVFIIEDKSQITRCIQTSTRGNIAIAEGDSW